MYYFLVMKLIGIEWDDDKNELNKQLRDLAFEQADYFSASSKQIREEELQWVLPDRR